jgi:hypothetical protein
MEKKGVKVVSYRNSILACKECGTRWTPLQRHEQKRMSPGYWKCPNGCNVPEK